MGSLGSLGYMVMGRVQKFFLNMKGFTPRERNGIIALGCIVLLCLATGPVTSLCGCTGKNEGKHNIYKVSDPNQSRNPTDQAGQTTLADQTAQTIQTAPTSQKSQKGLTDWIDSTEYKYSGDRDVSTKRKSRRKSSKKKVKSNKGKNKRKHNSGPRRSLHDEPLD